MIEEKSYIATWCPVCDKQVSIEERDKNGALRISSNRVSSPVTPVDSSGKKNEPKKVYDTRGRYRCD
ncbi:hypothetical protein ALC62_09156 [Cyphomyrmex costatus]|uniref:Uncharacterized protein n=1 Tax=Cyphomyrmex costatus TaxID=456900 RepID=A0A195CJ50_9HYME|nr:hypothetical protein ALC62_09156 [Cyphomyrmex costatus]